MKTYASDLSLFMDTLIEIDVLVGAGDFGSVVADFERLIIRRSVRRGASLHSPGALVAVELVLGVAGHICELECQIVKCSVV